MFLDKHSRLYLGFEYLALLYSLPYAFVMWRCDHSLPQGTSSSATNYSISSVAFMIAIAFLCFQATSTFVRVIMGVAWLFVLTAALWCIWSGLKWDERRVMRWKDFPRRLRRVLMKMFRHFDWKSMYKSNKFFGHEIDLENFKRLVDHNLIIDAHSRLINSACVALWSCWDQLCSNR